MASAKIKAHIQSKMKRWDGTPDLPEYGPYVRGTPEQIDKAMLQQWLRDWREFGRRVRRDILVLEKLLVDKGVIDKADLYGDPGDPPPDLDI